jgi:leucine-rich repeat-containing protein 16
LIPNKYSKYSLKQFVLYEVKENRLERRILCLSDYRLYLIAINSKTNKPNNKIDTVFHLLDIKNIESKNQSELIIHLNDIISFKFYCSCFSNNNNNDRKLSISSQETTDNEQFTPFSTSHQCLSINLIITSLFIMYNEVFAPTWLIEMFDNLSIEPSDRFNKILIDSSLVNHQNRSSSFSTTSSTSNRRRLTNFYNQNYNYEKYSKAYLMFCDQTGSQLSATQEVAWDINEIYSFNSIKELSLNDFDYLNPKDMFPLISALRYNSCFDSFHCDGIKFTNEMQDTLNRIITTPINNIKRITIINANLRSDFFAKMQTLLQQNGVKVNQDVNNKQKKIIKNGLETQKR